jgi:hypothetical protein
MNDGNMEHVRHVKHRRTPPKEKTGVAHHEPSKALKPLVNLNNIFEYGTNTNVTT